MTHHSSESAAPPKRKLFNRRFSQGLLARSAGAKLHYSPPTVRPSTRIVGAATDPRNSRSLAISEILKNNSFKFPATVISSTGYANSPPEIQRPEAPRE